MRASKYENDSSLGEPLTVIDASAGTGKTYTICDRVVREIIAGHVQVQDVAVITFTNAAAHELIARMRKFLSSPLEHCPAELVVDGDKGLMPAAQQRVNEALAGLASATIGTIHHFCIELLAAVGTRGTQDPGRALEANSELLNTVANDATVRAASDQEFASASLSSGVIEPFNKAAQVKNHLLSSVHVPLHPRRDTSDVAPRSDLPDVAESYADWGRSLSSDYRLSERLAGRMDNDELLALALKQLDEPAVVKLVRARWKLLVVDEFQDTDPTQWQIVKRGFLDHASPDTRVIVVGDPKQSIYRFRGADIQNYSDACELGDKASNRRYTLRTNYRSLPPVVKAVNGLLEADFDMFGDGQAEEFGKGTVNYKERQDKESQDPDSMPDANPDTGILVRALLPKGNVLPDKVGEVRNRVRADLALYVKDCLAGKAGREARRTGKTQIAVLVNSTQRATEILGDLRSMGIRAVFVHSESVLESNAAKAWRSALVALENPHDTSAVLTAELSVFGRAGSWSSLMDTNKNELDADKLSDAVERWFWLGKILADRGFQEFWSVLKRENGVAEKLLATASGEEVLTDVMQIADILQAQWRKTPSVQNLSAWFAQRIESARDNGGQAPDEVRRRVPSEEADVQIMTYHGAKGLQFPVVLLPNLWDESSRGLKGNVVFVRQGEGTETSLNASEVIDEEQDAAQGRLYYLGYSTIKKSNPPATWGTENAGFLDRIYADDLETERLESGRKTYVALTRAEELTVVWQPVWKDNRADRRVPWRSVMETGWDSVGDSSGGEGDKGLIGGRLDCLKSTVKGLNEKGGGLAAIPGERRPRRSHRQLSRR